MGPKGWPTKARRYRFIYGLPFGNFIVHPSQIPERRSVVPRHGAGYRRTPQHSVGPFCRLRHRGIRRPSRHPQKSPLRGRACSGRQVFHRQHPTTGLLQRRFFRLVRQNAGPSARADHRHTLLGDCPVYQSFGRLDDDGGRKRCGRFVGRIWTSRIRRSAEETLLVEPVERFYTVTWLQSRKQENVIFLLVITSEDHLLSVFQITIN